MSKLPKDRVLSWTKFSQSNALKVQNEVQSMHWHSFHITYYNNPNFVEGINLEEPKILKEMLYYIFDEREHDLAFMQHALNLN